MTHAEPDRDRSAAVDQNVLEAALHWGASLLSVRRLKVDGALTLGSSDDADLYVADASLLAASQQFVTRRGDEVWLQPVAGMMLFVDGEKAPPMATRLLKGSEARFVIGALEIRLRWTSASRTITVPLLGGIDFLYTRVLATALILQAAFVAGMMLTPTFPDDDESLIAQAVRWVQAPSPDKPKPTPKPVEVKVKVAENTEKTVFGMERKQVAKARTAVKRDERELAEAAANEVLAAMFGAEGTRGGLSGVFNDLPASIDGLGTGSKPAGDGGGWGTRGTGPGGGGNSIGIGNLRSGKGGFSGRGDDSLGGLCDGRPCKKGHPVTRPGPVRSVGGLEKEEIQRVVGRHLSQVKACFNRELTKDPNLDGKLTMSWVIGGSGLVVTSKVAEDTVRSPAMSACVKRVVDRMKFPRPRGGGTVSVRYPFLFST